MSIPTRVNFNTNEEVLSSDLNRVGNVAAAAALDSLLAANGAAARNVVARGLNLSTGTGLQVTVSAGAAARYDASNEGVDTSALIYGELASAATASLSAASPGNPRIDVISVGVSQVDSGSQTRSVIQLPARTVTSQSLDKTSRGELTVNVTSGTPAASPAFPTPASATDIILGYVFVGAGATSVASEDIIEARSAVQPNNGPTEGALINGLSTRTFRDPTDTFNRVAITAGNAYRAGGFGRQTIDIETDVERLFAGGSGSLSADTEYYIYAVPSGPSTPATAPFVFAVSTTAPDEAGVPSAAISYSPFQTIGTSPAPGREVATTTTLNGLFVGGFRTDASGNVQGVDSSPLLAPQGTANLPVVETRGTAAGSRNFWFAKPALSFANATDIEVTGGVGMVANECSSNLETLTGSLPADVLGTRATSDFMYVFLRKTLPRSATTLVPRRDSFVVRISDTPPDQFARLGAGATPETNFTRDDYIYCGAVFLNAAQEFHPFSHESGTGRHYFGLGLPVGTTSGIYGTTGPTPSGDPTQDSTTSAIATFTFGLYIPETTRRCAVSFRISNLNSVSPSRQSIRLLDVPGTGPNSTTVLYGETAPPSSPANALGPIEISARTGRNFEIEIEAFPAQGSFNQGIFDVKTHYFVEDVNNPVPGAALPAYP